MKESLAIILCTYNGERFLKEQLESYRNQTFKNWTLFVFDDQSTDRTKEIVEEFSQKIENKVFFKRNDQKLGFAKNFLHNLKGLDGFDYYAFSDQDDVWLKKKLEKSIDYLSKKNIPSLYCGRTMLIDEGGSFIGVSPCFKKEPSFKNALVQSIAGGNTMVFNKNLYKKISTLILSDVVTHDWIIYQITTVLNGDVFYDKEPFVLYRQHQFNLIGSNIGFFSKLYRFKRLLKKDFLLWNNQNIIFLKNNNCVSDKNNKSILDLFEKSRNPDLFFQRLYFLKKSGVYRQSFFSHVALYIACLIKKI